jgi:hypothetical protein
MSKYYSKIHVQYKNGSKASSVKVYLAFTSLLGGVTKTFYTDRNGTAIVEHAGQGEAKVIVKGTTRCKIKAPGETVVFI